MMSLVQHIELLKKYFKSAPVKKLNNRLSDSTVIGNKNGTEHARSKLNF